MPKTYMNLGRNLPINFLYCIRLRIRQDTPPHQSSVCTSSTFTEVTQHNSFVHFLVLPAALAAMTTAGSIASEDEMAAWEDNWDDDTVEEDFAVQLVRFARKRAHSPPPRSPEEPAAKKRCSRSSPMQVDDGEDQHVAAQQVRLFHKWHGEKGQESQ